MGDRQVPKKPGEKWVENAPSELKKGKLRESFWGATSDKEKMKGGRVRRGEAGGGGFKNLWRPKREWGSNRP